MLPFLKLRDEAGIKDEDEGAALTRKPDERDDYDMLDAVAEDLLMAIEHKDKAYLKDALSSLVTYIQTLDEEQDAGQTEEPVGGE